jgi:hypothetical protein
MDGAILDTKGVDVAIIEPTADLAFAVKLLAARAIGALVVRGKHGDALTAHYQLCPKLLFELADL